MKVANHENNIKFITSIFKDLQEVSSVLHEFGITSIGYSRFYDNKCIRLSNNVDWMEHYLNNNILYSDKARYTKELGYLGERKHYMMLREKDKNSKSIVSVMNKYDQDNVCSFYIKNDNYVEMFGFATNKGKDSLTNFYINNTSFLLKYSLLFKERLFPVINRNLDSISLPFSIFKQVNPEMYSGKDNLEQKIKLKKIYLADDLIVTVREFECLRLLSRGYSYKEIAQKMCISFRTVETHVNHMKYKMGQAHKGGILKLLENFPIITQ